MKKRFLLGSLAASLLASQAAHAEHFEAGTLIIPMDTTYQDSGMLKAYGLVYELLRNGISVHWAIRKGKQYGGTDFTASATPYPSGAAITAYGYRGGPWLINSLDAPSAVPIIASWKSRNTTTVHVSTTAFDADIARRLVVAPTIAMVADGNQKIARAYMQAAGIPDSTLSLAWADTSPDMLTPAEIAGPTTTNHSDGKLFDNQGAPVYCQLMSMHWGVNDARDNPEVVAEVRSFLNHPTHFFAECQAVNAFENDPVNGHFLTPHGFLIAAKPTTLDFLNADYPFAQLDGPFKTVGGSEPAYTLPTGDQYKDQDIVMLTTHGSPVGVGDLWMTGYLDGACSIDGEGGPSCLGIGKVSYLGGHDYEVALPISAHPDTQGTRLFLNSLFEAPCATLDGQPLVYLQKAAPPNTTTAQLTFTLSYLNQGPTTVLATVLHDAIPAGSTFVSATGGGVFTNGEVRWNLGNLGNQETGQVSFTVTLGAHGNYQNQAFLDYRVGLNPSQVESNTTTTLFDNDTDADGVLDSADNCPQNYNPLQDLDRDILSCGTCGNLCSVANGTPRCNSGTCSIGSCNNTHSDCDRAYPTGCEYASAGFADDENNCGGCGIGCDPLHSTGLCWLGSCTVGSCDSGFADCNHLAGDGCEYDTAGFPTDRNHCGNCDTRCGNADICQAGSCVPSPCPAGRADCGGVAGDCETVVSTNANNCGGCGIVCAPQHATGSCSAGNCSIGTCNSGYSDCNGLAGDGCEYDQTGFQNDPQNCGACGSACAPANGNGACASGTCTITGCAPDHEDCNGLVADGCEYAVTGFATDPANCGGCGTICAPAHATGVCASGSCGIGTCDTGYVDIDEDEENGCETACTPTGLPETDCNGDDDDCDGEVDEDYVPTSCGVGSCTADSTCVGGSETCTPAPSGIEGPAGAPNCSDGADNDCDGSTDSADPACDMGTGEGGAGGADPGTGGTSGTGTGAAGTGNGASGEAGAGDGGAPDGTGGTSATGGSTAGRAGASGSGTAGTGADTGTAGEDSGPAPGGEAKDSGDTGGCGCHVTPRPASPLRTAGTLALLALVALRRRGRRRDAAA
jgi:uncharacterized repeat protein (TIGR01451 family)/MYXO-CTERM domain-containing protein